jgi:hypothetical protein
MSSNKREFFIMKQKVRLVGNFAMLTLIRKAFVG